MSIPLPKQPILPAQPKRQNCGTWINPAKGDSDCKHNVGFIYYVHFPDTDEIYVGQKLYWVKRNDLRAKPKQSNWRTYKTSSHYVKDRMERESFKAEIMHSLPNKCLMDVIECLYIIRSIKSANCLNESIPARNIETGRPYHKYDITQSMIDKAYPMILRIQELADIAQRGEEVSFADKHNAGLALPNDFNLGYRLRFNLDSMYNLNRQRVVK